MSPSIALGEFPAVMYYIFQARPQYWPLTNQVLTREQSDEWSRGSFIVLGARPITSDSVSKAQVPDLALFDQSAEQRTVYGVPEEAWDQGRRHLKHLSKIEIKAGLAPLAKYAEVLIQHLPEDVAPEWGIGWKRLMTRYDPKMVREGMLPPALYSANFLYGALTESGLDMMTMAVIDPKLWVDGYEKVFAQPSIEDVRNGRIADWANYILYAETHLSLWNNISPEDWENGFNMLPMERLKTRDIRSGRAPPGMYAIYRICDFLNLSVCKILNRRLGDKLGFHNHDLWMEGWMRATTLESSSKSPSKSKSKSRSPSVEEVKRDSRPSNIEQEVRSQNHGSLFPNDFDEVKKLTFVRQPRVEFAHEDFPPPTLQPATKTVIPQLIKDLRWERNSCYMDATMLALFYRPNSILDQVFYPDYWDNYGINGSFIIALLEQVNKLRSGRDMATMSSALSKALRENEILSKFGLGKFCAVEEFIDNLLTFLHIRPIGIESRLREWVDGQFTKPKWNKIEHTTIWNVEPSHMQSLAECACDAIDLRAVALLSTIRKKQKHFTVEEKRIVKISGLLIIHLDRHLHPPLSILPPEKWGEGNLNAIICYRNDHFTTYFRGYDSWYFYDGKVSSGPTIQWIRPQGKYTSYDVMLRLNEREFPSVMKEGKIYVYASPD